MTPLIERLEGLSGPCRETDAEIYCLLHPEFEPQRTHALGGVVAAGKGRISSPAYTSSIDSALPWVPEGLDTNVNFYADGTGFAQLVDDDGGLDAAFNAANPAIALWIAILRAMEAANG